MSEPVPVKEVLQDPGSVTNLLLDWRNGDQSALDRLTPIIYEDLLRLARARLKGEYRQCTLQPTALVHESYLRLADQTRLECESRTHFYAVAANVMRRVLIDYARKRKAQKRGAGVRITLKTGMDFANQHAPDSLLVDEALQKLAQFDERKSQAIELKFFGGMTTEEIGTVLGISVATVGRELRVGQAWLRREMSRREMPQGEPSALA
jgi:RNA polymerase sigma factor (TIGR02999 family)